MAITRTPLSDAEFGIVQRYIDYTVEEHLKLGLSTEIEHDWRLFAQLRRQVGFLYPSFDPAVSELDPQALWGRTVTAQGDTVALSAARVFETEDFFELLRSQRLWYKDPPQSSGASFTDEMSRHPPIAGSVAHVGGLWVEPSWRKLGLSHSLPWTLRALLLRNSAIDHVTGLVFDDIAKSSLPKGAYGFPLVTKIIEGHFPPTGGQAAVHLCYIPRQDLIARMARELEAAERAAAAVG
jgi:hypothetical protein